MNFDSKLTILVCIALLTSSTAFAKKRESWLHPEYGAFSLSDIPIAISELKEAFIDPTPVDRKDGVAVGALGGHLR